MLAETHIGVDVGGGGIRVRAATGGRALSAADHGPVPRSAGQVDTRAVATRIGALVAQLCTRADRVAVGLTGMPGLLESPAELAAEVHRQVVTASVVVASDALTTHLGALAGRPGCVVAAGTGVIVLGTDHATTWRQADGWGHLLGDDGSGAWIGAAGLRAALRHRDGRGGGSAVLLDKLVRHFGDTATALGVVYGAPSAAHELAAFAPSVAEAAHEGDPVAAEIWQRAGELLAESAHAAAGALLASGPRFRTYGTAPTIPAAPRSRTTSGLPEPTSAGTEFSWGGRLFDAGPLLLAPFRAELTRRLPEAHLTAPAGDAVHGALLLARRGLPADHLHPAQYAVEIPAG